MSIENEISKLTKAIEANTAAILQQSTGGCSKVANAPEVPKAAEVPAQVPAAPSAPAAAQPVPVPAAPVAVPAAPTQPAAVKQAVTKEQVNETLQAKALAMGDGGAAIFAVLQDQFQAANVSALDPSRYADLITVVNGLGA